MTCCDSTHGSAMMARYCIHMHAVTRGSRGRGSLCEVDCCALESNDAKHSDAKALLHMMLKQAD